MRATCFGLLLAVWFATLPATAATSGTIVGATVPSATAIDDAGCLPLVPNVTDFGSVLPGSTSLTSVDCEIEFGSSNDTSMLRMYQSDQGGDAMVSGPTSGAGVLGYWPFNGSGDDVTATGNDAAPASNPADPSYTAAAPTGRDRSIDMDGDDYSTIPHHASYNAASFTVDLWVRTTDTNEIVGRSTAACSNAALCQWELWMNASGVVQANIEVGATEHSAISSVDINDGAWHHLAMTVDDVAKEIRIYVDGVHAGTDATWAAGSADTGTIPIRVGTNGDVNTFLDGDIDELRFQTGVRTAAQIGSYHVGRVQDYANGSNDWDTAAATTRAFAACLREVADGGATDGTTWVANAGCTQTDDPWWRPVVATGATAGSKVAIAPSGDIDAKARLRFGIRLPNSQQPGLYTAPITFEVVAPVA